jgi:ATP-dependent DNA helicase RecG
MSIVDPQSLLRTLCEQPRETEWLEFKHNKFDADEVGQYVSALANSAMFENQNHGYLVFGVEDGTHRVVGTSVRLKDEKVGNENFENWLTRWLDPRLNLHFVSFDSPEGHIEIIVIEPAYQRPVAFKHEMYIRVDSVKKNLRDYPERTRTLWAITSRFSFEQGIAASHLSVDRIFELFACEELIDLLRLPKRSREGIIGLLLDEELIVDDKQGGFDATNLLALVAARDISQFEILRKKAPRVITYEGNTKSVAIDDTSGNLGYAVAYPRLLKYIMDRVPHREEIRHGVRVTEYSYPEISIREFLANALIHQDLTSVGDGPLIEIYGDKLEITNPGAPLVTPDRFIDAPAKSRNERLAGLMRRLGFCEERGSGIDRALEAIEAQSLPPPLFREVENSTVVTLFAERAFAAMSKTERIRACYQHASLRFLASNHMSNSSLRRRLGLSDAQYPQASNVIKDATEVGLIKPLDAEQANRNARYIPHWA